MNALLLAEVMAWHGKRLGELVAMLHQRIRRTPLWPRRSHSEDGHRQKRALAHFARFKAWPLSRLADRSAAKISMESRSISADIGWVMVRASGTEHMLRVYAETTRPETTRRILDEVSGFVREI